MALLITVTISLACEMRVALLGLFPQEINTVDRSSGQKHRQIKCLYSQNSIQGHMGTAADDIPESELYEALAYGLPGTTGVWCVTITALWPPQVSCQRHQACWTEPWSQGPMSSSVAVIPRNGQSLLPCTRHHMLGGRRELFLSLYGASLSPFC